MQQWFGVLVRSPLAEERWLASGLAGSLAGKVVAKHFGENEGAYQWSRKLDLVVAEQDDASPSIAHTGQAGFGLAQELQRYTSSHVLRHKADLLVWMVENRTGAEPFQRWSNDARGPSRRPLALWDAASLAGPHR